jgi:hypothetical protein
MGSFLVQLLTDPGDFKFYGAGSEGQIGGVSNFNTFGQKSIPFGHDKPYGGSSKQPYIKYTTPSNQPLGTSWNNFTNSFQGGGSFGNTVTNIISSLGTLAGSAIFAVDNLPNFEDSILRGGPKAISRSVLDATRLTRYFFDTSNIDGFLFIAKQNLLSRVDIKTEPARTGLAYAMGALNGGVYTPLSTIGQAAAGFAGVHLNKQGIDPTGLIPPLSLRSYQKVVYDRNQGDTTPEESKGFQRKVDRKVKRITKKQSQLEKYRQQLATAQAFNPTGKQDLVPYNGKYYTSNSEALQQFYLDLGAEALASAGIPQVPQTWADLEGYLDDVRKKDLKAAEKYDKQLQKAAEKIYKEDQKAEAEATKKISKLQEQITEATEDLEEFRLDGKYKNRLLRLWNKFGLDPNTPVDSNKSTMISYSGGPGSILGIGRTKIHFATLNDGETPMRTNRENMNDPYKDFGYLNYGPKNPIKYRVDNILGDGSGLTSVFYASGFYPEEYFGDPDYFTNASLISFNTPNSLAGLQPWINNWVVIDGKESNKSSTIFPFKYETWPLLLYRTQPQTDRYNPEFAVDFRSKLDASESYTFLSLSPDYRDKNVETNYHLGNPGAPGDVTNYSVGKKSPFTKTLLGPSDLINAIPVYRSELTENLPSTDLTNDIIPFKISILDNGSVLTLKDPSTGQIIDQSKYFHVHFRAFIEGFSDSYNASWKKIEYMGRGEKFFKYGGFDRDINLSFTVAAQSKDELVPIYRKLNFIASSLTPYYTDNGYMAGNIAYMTVGDYLVNQSGIINNFSIDVEKDSPWETGININGDVDGSIPRLPFMVKVKMKFTPIQTFRPEIQKPFNTDSKPLKGTDLQTLNDIQKYDFFPLGADVLPRTEGDARYIGNGNNPLYFPRISQVPVETLDNSVTITATSLSQNDTLLETSTIESPSTSPVSEGPIVTVPQESEVTSTPNIPSL